LPLNALDRHQFKIAYDWTAEKLTDFARYYNRFVWRSAPLREYQGRKDQAPVFAGVQL